MKKHLKKTAIILVIIVLVILLFPLKFMEFGGGYHAHGYEAVLYRITFHGSSLRKYDVERGTSLRILFFDFYFPDKNYVIEFPIEDEEMAIRYGGALLERRFGWWRFGIIESQNNFIAEEENGIWRISNTFENILHGDDLIFEGDTLLVEFNKYDGEVIRIEPEYDIDLMMLESE